MVRRAVSGPSDAGSALQADPARTTVKPIRGQLIKLRLASRAASRVIWGSRCYLVPWRDGSVLVGATSEDVGFDETATAEGVRYLLEASGGLLPVLHGRGIRGRARRPAADDPGRVAGHRPFVHNAQRVLRHRPLSQWRPARAADRCCSSRISCSTAAAAPSWRWSVPADWGSNVKTPNPDSKPQITASGGFGRDLGFGIPDVRLKKFYTSREVAGLTGLTARQLQWWDSRRVFAAAVGSQRTEAGGFTERRYTAMDVLELQVLADLRRRGFTIPQLRRLLTTLRDVFRYPSVRSDRRRRRDDALHRRRSAVRADRGWTPV